MIPVIPGEAAIVAICSLLEKIVDGQTPEFRAEMGRRWLELTQPLHDALVRTLKPEDKQKKP
jgi:hypothetical protein